MDLTGFKAFDFSEGLPYVSMTKNGLTFNKAVTMKLGCPEYVRLLINYETRQFVLQACDNTVPRAIKYYRQGKDVFSVRLNSRDLISTFERLVGTSFEPHGFRVNGELVDDKTMLFDINAAEELS